MVDLSDWDGQVRGRSDDFDELWVVIPGVCGGSWGGPFRATARDSGGRNADYFVKSLQTCQPGQQASLAIEQVVGAAGRLIGAPVCRTSLIRIPAALAGTPTRPASPPLEAGLAHASRALDHAEEGRPALASRANDDNRRRHVGVYALYDWCFGTDQQWLYDLDDDRRLYSHDHGLYFPPTNQGLWTRADLIALVDEPHELPDPPTDLSAEAAKAIALALESVTRSDLAKILRAVPAGWPVTDQDLEALGWFLERRAPEVASRVRGLA
jgi:hypothetical protein